MTTHSMYKIRREGQIYGPFTETEIKDMIVNSVFSMDDEISKTSAQTHESWQKIQSTNLYYHQRMS